MYTCKRETTHNCIKKNEINLCSEDVFEQNNNNIITYEDENTWIFIFLHIRVQLRQGCSSLQYRT